MQKLLTILLLLSLVLTLSACSKKASFSPSKNDTIATSTTAIKDGDYSYESERDSETYKTYMTYTIENGLIKTLDWYIYDTTLNRKFDETYKEVYEAANQPKYVKQSIDDWNGAITYGPTLIASQGEFFDLADIDALDSISGATWTYKKFTSALKESSGITD